MTKKILEDLKRIGLGKNESAVYVALSQLGRSKAGKIIEESGVHRNLVYQALASLQEKQLVNKSTVGKVAAFAVADPSRLLDLLYEKELTAKRVVEEIKRMRSEADQEIQVFEGVEAVRTYWMSIARSYTEDPLHIIGSGGKRFEEVMGKTLKRCLRTFGQNGGAKVLQHQAQGYTHATDELMTTLGMEVRPLLAAAPPEATMAFISDRVIFAMYTQESVVIEIRSAPLARAYQEYFELMWNQRVQVETGWDAMQRSYDRLLRDVGRGGTYHVLGGSGLDLTCVNARFFAQVGEVFWFQKC